jgi:hypothetical protein
MQSFSGYGEEMAARTGDYMSLRRHGDGIVAVSGGDQCWAFWRRRYWPTSCTEAAPNEILSAAWGSPDDVAAGAGVSVDSDSIGAGGKPDDPDAGGVKGREWSGFKEKG